MNRTVTPSLLFIIAGFIVGCSSKAVRQPAVNAETRQRRTPAATVHLVPLSERIDPRAYMFYVNATLYEQLGDPFQAVFNYRQALRFYPDSYPIRYALAENLYRIQKFRDALNVLAEIDPQDADVFELKAALYQAIGAEDSACLAYLQLVQLDSTNSAAYSYLAGVYRKQSNLDSTIWAYRQLVRIRPDNQRLWIELAKLQAQKGDIESAKSSFWSAVTQARQPIIITSFIGLAELYQAEKRSDSALIVLKRALQIEPYSILIHRELANLYIRLDSLALAVPHVRKEVELAPLDRAAARRLGILYYWMDSLQQADSVLTSLVDSGERNPVNHSFLGRIALRRENLEKAREEFAIVTQLADSDYESWLDLGFVYRLMGKPELEIQTYQTGLNHVRDEQSQLRLLFALGAAYEQNSQVEQAIATFEEIIARDSDYAQALNYLGYMLADRGIRLEYAHDLIVRAVALSPDNAAYLDSYGWVLYRLGKYDQALVHLKKAVTLDSDPVIFDHLGDVYRAIGDLKEARTWWQKALEMDPDNEQVRQKLGP
ncbi:MAG: tetratricopeptide repeat protein [Candidatus Zixiibacteriota bacterium]